jgi:hypothetical protein
MVQRDPGLTAVVIRATSNALGRGSGAEWIEPKEELGTLAREEVSAPRHRLSLPRRYLSCADWSGGALL